MICALPIFMFLNIGSLLSFLIYKHVFNTFLVHNHYRRNTIHGELFVKILHVVHDVGMVETHFDQFLGQLGFGHAAADREYFWSLVSVSLHKDGLTRCFL